MPALFSISAETDKAITALNAAPKALRWAYVIGATRTAKIMAAELKQEMPRAFDRPTPYAVRSISWLGATMAAPIAKIGFGLSAFGSRHLDWAQAEVHGGVRPLKAIEKRISALLGAGEWYVTPGRGARLDRYGNISGGQIQQILSDLGLQRDPYANATAASRKRNRRARYFVLRKGGKPIGIAVRRGRTMDIALLLTRKAPTYTPAYRMMDVAQRVTREVFPAEVAKAFIV